MVTSDTKIDTKQAFKLLYHWEANHGNDSFRALFHQLGPLAIGKPTWEAVAEDFKKWGDSEKMIACQLLADESTIDLLLPFARPKDYFRENQWVFCYEYNEFTGRSVWIPGVVAGNNVPGLEGHLIVLVTQRLKKSRTHDVFGGYGVLATHTNPGVMTLREYQYLRRHVGLAKLFVFSCADDSYYHEMLYSLLDYSPREIIDSWSEL